MDYIEVTGKTVEEALTNAMVKLGTSSDNIEYDVIEKGSSGFLGFGAKAAVIKARKKEEKIVVDDKKEDPIIASAAKKLEEVAEETVSETVEKEEAQEEVKEEVVAKAESLSKEEIERRIRTFLSDMFGAMAMDVKVDIHFNEKDDCVEIELSGDNMGVLIGKRGQTLDSIQYLTSLVVNKGKEKYVRVKVDTENYRSRRKETLESLAKNIAYRVKRSKRPVSLEPMNPYERRIIHAALQSDKYVSTRSEGEEPMRHVVIYLDKERNENK